MVPPRAQLKLKKSAEFFFARESKPLNFSQTKMYSLTLMCGYPESDGVTPSAGSHLYSCQKIIKLSISRSNTKLVHAEEERG